MKIGALVRFNDELGIFLGLKTFDSNYTCSEVYMMEQKEIRPIQSNLLEVVSEGKGEEICGKGTCSRRGCGQCR